MDYEKAYKEAKKRVKIAMAKCRTLPLATVMAVDYAISYIFNGPDESEDERIRRDICALVRKRANFDDVDRMLAYLEKQKERDLDIVPELRPTAWGEGYQHGCKDTEEKYAGMIVVSPEVWDNAISDAFENGKKEGEKQKEPHYTKRNALFDNCVENCDPAIMKEVSDNVDKMLEKEPKPAEIDEYKIIKKHITEDALSSEVNKRLKECGWFVTDEKPTEWSEEDEKMLARIIERGQSQIQMFETGLLPEHIAWLKSLRPSWKPSEEQMKALNECFRDYYDCGCVRIPKTLESLYYDLKKLM